MSGRGATMELLPTNPLPLPSPKQPIEITPATPSDLDWIDALQKRHRNGVGWHPRGALEGKVALGQIIVARTVVSREWLVVSEGNASSSLTTNHKPLTTPVGYCMASDRYMKREDCGIIYQVNVEP